jgi:hypothetical protein
LSSGDAECSRCTRNKTLVALLGTIFVLLVFATMLCGVIGSMIADPAPPWRDGTPLSVTRLG